MTDSEQQLDCLKKAKGALRLRRQHCLRFAGIGVGTLFLAWISHGWLRWVNLGMALTCAGFFFWARRTFFGFYREWINLADQWKAQGEHLSSNEAENPSQE